jgi:ribosome-associated toxin RatA of RatAB toxin-antitoxin module
MRLGMPSLALPSPRAVLASLALALASLASTGCATAGGSSPAPSEPKAAQADKVPSQDELAKAAVAPPGAEFPPEAEPVAVPIEGGGGLSRYRSTLTVAAPLEKVRETVLDFSPYPEFMPEYSKAKLLGRTPTGARDVYMEMITLGGLVRLWFRIEVPKPVVEDGWEVYTSKYVEGNVKEAFASWRMRAKDPNTTELALEVFMQPNVPLPSSLLNDANRRGAGKGIYQMAQRIVKGAAHAPNGKAPKSE